MGERAPAPGDWRSGRQARHGDGFGLYDVRVPPRALVRCACGVTCIDSEDQRRGHEMRTHEGQAMEWAPRIYQRRRKAAS